jgi:hypothetical protein
MCCWYRRRQPSRSSAHRSNVRSTLPDRRRRWTARGMGVTRADSPASILSPRGLHLRSPPRKTDEDGQGECAEPPRRTRPWLDGTDCIASPSGWAPWDRGRVGVAQVPQPPLVAFFSPHFFLGLRGSTRSGRSTRVTARSCVINPRSLERPAWAPHFAAQSNRAAFDLLRSFRGAIAIRVPSGERGEYGRKR